MDRWAAEKKYDCHFICVCMLADKGASQLSLEFANQLKLQYCINAFIDNPKDLPEYGQLGCSGFIVMDETHNVVSTCTSAFMQVRSLAFSHVETLLDSILAKTPPPQVCPGEFVKILAGEKDVAGATAICLQVQDGAFLQLQLLTGARRQNKIRVPASEVWKLGSPSDPERGCCSSGECGSRKSCALGGCEPTLDDCQQDETPLDDAFLTSMLSLVSVRVPSMDEEHAECADALRRLAEELSTAALEAALATLREHFSHEESLFDQHGFGEHQDARFSAKRSHVDDHNRLLEKMRGQLRSQGPVPPTFVRSLLQDFHEHTSRYDVQYSDFLSSKCVA
eukprot:TRINITY_DN67398_c0_g1_i1.p1 TRINITY_DN67398_c0_g1~~TRINITY_DN67398_c0_g1_i1.p1  ORF type:complete len:337 (+),score=56.09 TRINITY_DN67398_c0_g1_i1:263-1273(+)